VGNKKKQRSAEKRIQHKAKHNITSDSIIAKNLFGFMSRFKWIGKYGQRVEIALLILVLVLGIAVRLEDITVWKQNSQRAFFNNEPIHTTFDAWFYLSLSKDLIEGNYNRIDEKRGVPQSPERPFPPPLISVAAAYIAKYTPFSLSWVAAVLPTILGPLLAIPLFFLGRYFGGPITGLCAAVISLLYPYYIHRSNIGRFDTDCMNVVWSVSAVYLFLRFGISHSLKRYCYFVAGLAVYVLFLWWWDQTPAVVGAIVFTPLVVALLFFYRAPRKELYFFYGFLLTGLIVFLMYAGLDIPVKAVKSIFTQFKYISKQSFGAFPNIGITISEQSKPSFAMILSYTSNNVLAFIFAVSGVIWLFVKRTRDSLFLVSLVILSVLALTYANRFIIFLIPVLAIGTGFSLKSLWDCRKYFTPLYFLCPLVFVLLTVPLFKANARYTQWPKENGITVEAMDYVKRMTPKDSVLWAWWDHGYAITYYARRATVNDGSIHGGERTVYTAIPYAAGSFSLSANFMHFYSVRGMAGIKKFYKAVGGVKKGLPVLKEILDSGPERARLILDSMALNNHSSFKSTDDWLEFFFPNNSRPIYLLADNLLTKINYWWYWFGTWNVENQEGIHPSYDFYYNLNYRDDMITNRRGLKINTEKGLLYGGRNRSFQLARILKRSRSQITNKVYNTAARLSFEYVEGARFGALVDDDISASVFNKLFIRHKYIKQYFKPLKLRAPYYQIWEVKGDTYKRNDRSAVDPS